MSTLQPEIRTSKRFERLTDAHVLTMISGGILIMMCLAAVLFMGDSGFNKPQMFLDILNRMRFGKNTKEDLDVLNQHVCNNMSDMDFYITVTSRNDVADKINESKLAEIDDKEYCFEAEKEGVIKTKDIPAPEVLKLKVGAQVIFCRNDYTLCINNR